MSKAVDLTTTSTTTYPTTTLPPQNPIQNIVTEAITPPTESPSPLDPSRVSEKKEKGFLGKLFKKEKKEKTKEPTSKSSVDSRPPVFEERPVEETMNFAPPSFPPIMPPSYAPPSQTTYMPYGQGMPSQPAYAPYGQMGPQYGQGMPPQYSYPSHYPMSSYVPYGQEIPPYPNAILPSSTSLGGASEGRQKISGKPTQDSPSLERLADQLLSFSYLPKETQEITHEPLKQKTSIEDSKNWFERHEKEINNAVSGWDFRCNQYNMFYLPLAKELIVYREDEHHSSSDCFIFNKHLTKQFKTAEQLRKAVETLLNREQALYDKAVELSDKESATRDLRTKGDLKELVDLIKADYNMLSKEEVACETKEKIHTKFLLRCALVKEILFKATEISCKQDPLEWWQEHKREIKPAISSFCFQNKNYHLNDPHRPKDWFRFQSLPLDKKVIVHTNQDPKDLRLLNESSAARFAVAEQLRKATKTLLEKNLTLRFNLQGKLSSEERDSGDLQGFVESLRKNYTQLVDKKVSREIKDRLLPQFLADCELLKEIITKASKISDAFQ